jgi:AAA15 family ATPase/GTPase
MAKIYSLKILNFRGIKKYEQVFGLTKFICLIGRGDSGKTTILDAISYVLSPSWNLTFFDSDFHKCEIDNPIEIEVSLYDLPKRLLQEDKYGLYERFLNSETGTIQDEAIDISQQVLTIKLNVTRDLEPKWFVINGRQEPKEIRANDRGSLNVFLVSDYIDRHFSWNKGNPLYSLLKQEDNVDESTNIIINALREAKSKIDDNSFNHLDGIIEQIKKTASAFGIDISNTSTTIDFKDISIKDGRICLHEANIPFRLKGKGSKRLISCAIQTELAKSGGIILIDEIEQGLEPDRVKHLTRALFSSNKGQIIITTHSQSVIEEIECENLLRIKNANGIVTGVFIPDDDKFQSLVRTCPEAVYAEKVIVCEGKTEIGFCRALDSFRIQNSKSAMATKDVVYTLGGGDGFTDRALKLKKLGLEVCVFCDSDKDNELKPSKEDLRRRDIQVFDWTLGNSLEKQIFDDLPWEGVKELIDFRIEQKSGDANGVKETIKHHIVGSFPADWQNTDSADLRSALYKASVYKKTNVNGSEEDKSWFKRIDHGEVLGKICYKYLTAMKGKKLEQQINDLSNWVDRA